jgi:hypothetical protein
VHHGLGIARDSSTEEMRLDFGPEGWVDLDLGLERGRGEGSGFSNRGISKGISIEARRWSSHVRRLIALSGNEINVKINRHGLKRTLNS